MIGFQLLAEIGLLASIWDAKAWYAVPLIVAVSLVYGATRHEYLKEIVENSIRSAFWVVCFMAVIFAIIYISGYWN